MIDRLLELLEAELGSHVRAVWLNGSRARGEEPLTDSDLLVVSTRGRPNDDLRVTELGLQAALAEGANRPFCRSRSTIPRGSPSAAASGRQPALRRGSSFDARP